MTNLATVLVDTATGTPTDRPCGSTSRCSPTGSSPRRARAVAGVLRARGLEPGDRVGMVFPNVPAVPAGCSTGRCSPACAVVPMNPLLKAREIEYYLEDSGAKFVFAWDDVAEAAGRGADAGRHRGAVVAATGRPPEQLGRRRAGRPRPSSAPTTTPPSCSTPRAPPAAQGRRAHPRQPAAPTPRPRARRCIEITAGRRGDGLPAALPRLRADLRAQRVGARPARA